MTDDSKTFSHSKSITKNLYVLHYKCRTSLTNDEVIYETVPTAMMMTMSHVIGLHISSIYTFSSFYIFSLAVCAITVAIFFSTSDGGWRLRLSLSFTQKIFHAIIHRAHACHRRIFLNNFYFICVSNSSNNKNSHKWRQRLDFLLLH